MELKPDSGMVMNAIHVVLNKHGYRGCNVVWPTETKLTYPPATTAGENSIASYEKKYIYTFQNHYGCTHILYCWTAGLLTSFMKPVSTGTTPSYSL